MSRITLAVASPRRPLLDSLKKKRANEADDDVVKGSAGWCPGVDVGVGVCPLRIAFSLLL